MSRKPMKQALNFETVAAAAAGRWREILVGLGIDAAFLKPKSGPCPGCGGKDKFRFDDKGGAKAFYCNGHGNGDEFDLLCHVHGWSKTDTLSRVAGFLRLSQTEPMTAAELTAIRERAEALKAQAAHDESERERRASERAQAAWEAASEADDNHPYLRLKQVKAHGLRAATYSKRVEVGGVWQSVDIENTLLIPLRNLAGELVAVQAIFPEPVSLPDGSPARNKDYLGPTAGGFHLIGTPDKRVFLVEGYATGASVFEATNSAVAVAFDAGNLGKVAHEVARRFPGSQVVVAADNDQWTEGNPGLTKGQTAAAAVGGVLVKPVFVNLAGKPTDFNDLAVREGPAQVAAVIDEQLTAADRAAKRANAKPSNVINLPGKVASPPPAAPRRKLSNGPTSYFCDDKGLFFQPPELPAPLYLGAPLKAVYRTRDKDADGWGVLFEFTNPDGALTEVDIPATALMADGPEAIKQLVTAGYTLAPGASARRAFVEYLGGVNPTARATRVLKLGWHDGGFLLPGYCIGNPPERLLYQNARHCQNTAATLGTLEQWRDGVAALCRGNPRLMFAVSAAFAAPLLGLLGNESGGFHLYGSGSAGKTTTLLAASSVWGGPDFMKSWRNTDNALEATAADHSDVLLPLDEIHQACSDKIGETVYMLGNGIGKRRANDPTVKKWRLLFFSCGERTLSQHLADAGHKLTAGMDARMPSIPADGGAGLGVFNELHGLPGPGALSDAFKTAAARHYGSGGPRFIELLLESGGLDADVPRDITTLATELAPTAGGQVRRVAHRFALVGFAGELAAAFGLTGWATGEATTAAKDCFNAWLGERGGSGNLEEQNALQQVSLYFQMHGNSRFQDWARHEDNHAPATVNRAGWKRADSSKEMIFYVLNEVFKSEVCKGLDPKRVKELLKAAGALVQSGGRDPKLCYPGLPSDQRRQWCVVINSKVFSLSDEKEGKTDAE